VSSTNLETGIGLRLAARPNTTVQQDSRPITRLARSMLEFPSFWSAADTLTGTELMQMIRKGRQQSKEEGSHPALQFYLLAG